MSHLLIVSLGPVQDFIAAARRFRDLWFGSWVLAELATAAAKALAAHGGQLIFPAPDALSAGGDAAVAKVANKLVAEVTDASAAAAAAEAAARDRLHTLAREAFARFARLDGFDGDTARAQLDDLLEFHWVAVPRGQDYAADRRRAEALLAARKQTRDFAPVAWGSDRPKSSLDGQREAVIDPGRLARRNEESLFRQFGLRRGENLCAPGLLKRHGGETFAVPSTAHMAALGSLTGAEASRVAPAAEALLAALAQTGLDESEYRRRARDEYLGELNGQVLFEERLASLYEGDAAGLAAARAAVKRFLHDAELRRPHPYYAVLLADGDRMGEAIDRQGDPNAHRRLSADLAGFAAGTGAIVSRHRGFLVYAGGDDVLALLPLDTVLACAGALARDFADRLRACGKAGDAPTLSVGVAVGHQMEPAGDTLDRARRAERAAKDAGRNALGLAIKKRGGAEQLMAGRWGTLDRRLDGWIAMHREGTLPDGAAYELRDLARALGDGAPEKAYQKETARILGRKRVADRVAVADAIQDAIVAQASGPAELRDLAEELVAARLFAHPGDR